MSLCLKYYLVFNMKSNHLTKVNLPKLKEGDRQGSVHMILAQQFNSLLSFHILWSRASPFPLSTSPPTHQHYSVHKFHHKLVSDSVYYNYLKR